MTMAIEREPEGHRPGRRVCSESAGDSIQDGIGIEQAGCFFGDDQRGSIGAKSDLREAWRSSYFAVADWLSGTNQGSQ